MNENESEIVNIDGLSAKRAYIVGGAIGGVLSLVPMALALCCLPLVISSCFSVYSFTSTHRVTISVGQGIKIGIISSFVAMIAYTIVYDLYWIAAGHYMGYEMMMSLLEKFMAMAPPEAQEQLSATLDTMETQKGFGIGALFSQFFSIILSAAIGGLLGGSLGAAIFKKGPLAK